MSTTVDQRQKGPNQVQNGPPKESIEKDFDPYFPQQHQGTYNSGTMSSPNVSEPYMANYYASVSFPYVNQGIDNAAWSNGGDPMSFLGGYGQMSTDYMGGGGMFSSFGYQPGYSWDFSGGDYSTWGPSAPQGRKTEDQRAMYADAAYFMNEAPYGFMNGDIERDMKNVEQGFKNVSIDPKNIDGHVNMHDMSQGVTDMGIVSMPVPSAPPKKTWANIASQPAKPQAMKVKAIPRAPVLPTKNNNMDIGTWDNRNGNKVNGNVQPRQTWTAPRGRSAGNGNQPISNQQQISNSTPQGNAVAVPSPPPHPVLDKLRSANQYNPKDFNLVPKNARYFITKSYAEDDIHRSIKYSIWCSTEHGNKRLDAAYREREGKGPVYLFFSVNGSGHFCGMAQMMSPLDYNASSSVWAQDKWKGQFEVKWIYVKDVPNSQLRHIKLENNENKPVTNSRDTQEVPPEKGKMVLKIIHNFKHSTSIFDDFIHYEKRQEEEPVKKVTKHVNMEKETNRPERTEKDRGDRSDRGERERSERSSRRVDKNGSNSN